MFNGVINIFKEQGFTSFDVVAKLRGILKQRKIGHTGTLDPGATGVLLVCLGNATKLCDLITDREKEYVVTFALGYTTDTLDSSGKILTKSDRIPSTEEILQAIAKYSNDYMQIPPMYSALKVDGKKLVNLAREGIEIERKARLVQIHEVEVLHLSYPSVQMRVRCGKGTYIRSLCDDIGRKLGCGATMTNLVRTMVSRFSLDTALTLHEVEQLVARGGLQEHILQSDRFFMHCPALYVKPFAEKYLYNGNKLELHFVSFPDHSSAKILDELSEQFKSSFAKANERFDADACYRVYDRQNRFCGVYTFVSNERVLKPYKLFLEREN